LAKTFLQSPLLNAVSPSQEVSVYLYSYPGKPASYKKLLVQFLDYIKVNGFKYRFKKAMSFLAYI